MTNIPIAKPLFGPEEIAAVAATLESGWIVQGPRVAEFEKRFAAFADVGHALACSNGTTALHLAYAALGLGQGDEVIVPAFTWVATPNAVVYCGARPVFCDIDLATYNIDPEAIESLITSRTRGIVPVHMFGLPAAMGPVLEIAGRHGLWVVEDAACAMGATVGGKHVGAFGDAATFSFHPRKSITTGEGGMVTTEREDVAAAVRSLRDHGVAPRRGEPSFLLPDYDQIGFNYRLTDVQGAIGCVQMDRAQVILSGRRERAHLYDDALVDLPWLRRPVVPAGMTHGYQAYVCTFAPEEPGLHNVDELERRRNALMTVLDARGIATRQGTHAPVLQSVYRSRFGTRPEAFPNAVLAEKLSLALPLYPQMTDDDQGRVVDALREVGPC
jgi:dTDP-4-amino-4,6-dideoxygalactose transaminase